MSRQKTFFGGCFQFFFGFLGEDINEGGETLLAYIENGSTLSDKNITDLWVGYVTAYENRQSKTAGEDSDVLEKIQSFMQRTYVVTPTSLLFVFSCFCFTASCFLICFIFMIF